MTSVMMWQESPWVKGYMVVMVVERIYTMHVNVTVYVILFFFHVKVSQS